MIRLILMLMCLFATQASAIIIVDLPPTPYEPPKECYEGYELSDSNECVRIEIRTCILPNLRDWFHLHDTERYSRYESRNDGRQFFRKLNWERKWWKHRYKHKRWDRCDRRAPRTQYGVVEVVIRDDGVIIAESECERQ